MPTLNVARSIRIESDPQRVYDAFRDFESWPRWSPWLLAEPSATVRFSADPSDVGGAFSWDGAVIGAGTLTHRQMQPPETFHDGQIEDRLNFTRPWKSEAETRIKISGDEGGTQVRWEMNGGLPWFLFWFKPTLEAMIGMDYERGLRMAKKWIETGEVDSRTDVRGVQAVGPFHVLGRPAETTLDRIGPSMEQSFDSLKQTLRDAGLATDGNWISIYDRMCLKTRQVAYTAGLVVAPETPATAGLRAIEIPACQAMHVRHTGRYDHLGNAWFAAYQHVQAAKRKPHRKLKGFERYPSEAEAAISGECVTDVYLPVR